MANTMSGRGGFVSRLGRTYGLYAAGFVAFVVLMAILNAIGVPDAVIGFMVVGFPLLVHAVIGVLGRTMQIGEYFVAGRRVPAFYNGMATGAGWMSGASFLGLAGTLYLFGQDGLAFVLGGTGGFVLAAVLVAPYLRKAGAYTVPDFLSARYGGSVVRLVGVLVLLSCSFAWAVAQLYAIGIISARFLGLDFSVAVHVGLAGVLVCAMLGGMRAVTWTQVAQYIVLVIACMVPVIWMSAARTGVPIPQPMRNEVLQGIVGLGPQLGVSPGHVTPFATGGHDATNAILLVLCLMAGTASLPHILMRSLTTPSMRAARTSVAWSLLFIVILCATAPAYAAFARSMMLELMQGGLTAGNIPEKAAWLINWAQADGSLVQICGKAALDAAAIAAACAEKGVTGALAYTDIGLAADLTVLATPDMAGMPHVVSALVAAGCFAAALASADGLLLAMANALGHDVYYKTIDRNAPTARRLAVSRILLALVAFAAAHVASTRPADMLAIVSWAFSLAAAGLFPALVLGIWWKRANAAGAVAGMVAGFAICLYYLLGTRYGAVGFYETWSGLSSASPEAAATFEALKAAHAAAAPEAQAAAWASLDRHAQTIADWWGVKSLAAAAFGLPLGFAVTVVVSMLTKEPSRELQDFAAQIRAPKGRAPMEETTD